MSTYSTKISHIKPLVVPCYNGKELEIDPSLVGQGLAALSIKHDLEDLARCKKISLNKHADDIPTMCFKKNELKSRNSFWCVHRPELRKLAWAKKLSTRQIAAVLEEHAFGDHYEDGNARISSSATDKKTSGSTGELKFLKTESCPVQKFGLDFTNVSQKPTDVKSAQITSGDELEFTPVVGPRFCTFADDDDLETKYRVHKSYVGMCIDMAHLKFRSPHVYIVADCESDLKDPPTTVPSPTGSAVTHNECVVDIVSEASEAEPASTSNSFTNGRLVGSNVSPTISPGTSSDLDSLSSALKLHEATARSCVPWSSMADSSPEQETLPIRKAFQHSPDEQDVTVILAPRYELPESESAQQTASASQLLLNQQEIAQIEERIRKNASRKNHGNTPSGSGNKKHSNLH